MIELLTLVGSDGRPFVKQSLIAPAVYLDTWAIRDFAENEAMGARFRDALITTRGTLFFSSLNFVDFAGMDDPRHMENAGQFIGSIAPRIFFSHFDPFIVYNRELKVMAGSTRESPAGDEGLLAEFASAVTDSNMQEAIAMWFRAVYRTRQSLRGNRDDMAKAFFSGTDAFRARMLADPDFNKDMRQPTRNADRPRSTFALIRILIAQMDADRSLPKTTNNAIDFLHCVVPAAYCNYILTDAQWYARLNRARNEMNDGGIAAGVAIPFTKRANGVEAFLSELESQRVVKRS